ncbi:hypothetical protein AX14_002019 [Amanita brunnescens Koide BX004]|nr:hypothetical protein AX14_002019 [Amanita brunnescens Koide BX004]
MPPEPRNPRLDTGRLVRDSHNTKDPPERSSRQERNKVVSNDLGAFAQQTSSARGQELKAGDRRIEAMSQYAQALEWSKEFNEQFIEYFSGIPCNDEYYLLYDECWARFAALGTGPNPCTIQEVLETFGPPRRSANVKRSTHTGERGSGSPPFLSARMSPHSYGSSPHEDARLVPTEREVFRTSQICARGPAPARRLSHHSPSRDTSLVSHYVSSLGPAVPKQPKDPAVIPVRAAADATKAAPIVEARDRPVRVKARKRADPSSTTPGIPLHIRKLLPCGSGKAHHVSLLFSDVGTSLGGGRQPVGTAGFNGPPDGSPRVGKVPMCGVANPSLSPSSREVPIPVPVVVRQPVKLRGAVNGKELSVAKHLPRAGTTLTPSCLLPVCSIRATPSCLLIGEHELPLTASRLLQRETVVDRSKASADRRSPMVSEAPMPLRYQAPVSFKGAVPHHPAVSMHVRSPERKAMVSKGQTSSKLYSPLCSAAPVLPERLEAAPSKHTIPFRSPSDESVPPVGHEAVGKAKQLSQAVDVAGCPVGDPIVAPECLFKRSIDVPRFAIQQGQCSALLGKVGEERRGYGPIINKVPSSPRGSFSKPVLCSGMTVRQRAPDIMVNEDIGANVMQCPPDAGVAIELPVPAFSEPKSAVEFCRSLGERLLPVEEACEQLDVSTVSAKLQAGIECSPIMETVQWQSPSLVVPVAGQLARAAAYIQERVNRRSPPCEEFGSRAPKGPPDRIEAMAEFRQFAPKVVNSKDGVDEPLCSLESPSPSALPVAVSALPAQTAALCQSVSESSLPVEISGQLGTSAVRVKSRASIRCSPVAEAAQRQVLPVVVLVEGGQLARAAAYRRERISGRSPGCDEVGRQAPEEPLDKVKAGPEAQRRPADVVAEERGAGVSSSPTSEPKSAGKPSCSSGFGGACRKVEPEKAYVPSHSRPEAVPSRHKPDSGASCIGLTRGEQELFTGQTDCWPEAKGTFS